MDVERILAATEDIITPVAVVDEEVVERNLARMAKLATDHNVKLRPHAKTHKSGYMAQRQMAHGAVGVASATYREAEVFAHAGLGGLLIAHRMSVRRKLRRLSAFADRAGIWPVTRFGRTGQTTAQVHRGGRSGKPPQSPPERA